MSLNHSNDSIDENKINIFDKFYLCVNDQNNIESTKSISSYLITQQSINMNVEKSNSFHFILIHYIIPYLTPNDLINFKLCNKLVSSLINQKAIDQCIISYSTKIFPSNEIRYNIWSNYLGIEEYKKKKFKEIKFKDEKNKDEEYYNELLKKVNLIKQKDETTIKEYTEDKLKIIYNSFDIIKKDIDRTSQLDYFKNGNGKIELKNILESMSIIKENVGYCQGMSFIGQFLLSITKYDEERSFDVFSALITKANYGNLMSDNFEQMKKYFYVFERLINIYLPDLDIVLKRNNVSASYYITPWFITLFTHSFCTNHTRLLLRIFDTFVFDGWICIIRIGLLLLKHYQNYLIEMKFEEILQFLINELKEKYDFFNNSNYDKFVELYHEMKIPKGLVINIENEFELNKKVEKIKQNYLEANSSDLSSNDDEENEENEMEF